MKSVRIRSYSGPNAGKYGPEYLRIWTLFTQCLCLKIPSYAYFLNTLIEFVQFIEAVIMKNRNLSNDIWLTEWLIYTPLIALINCIPGFPLMFLKDYPNANVNHTHLCLICVSTRYWAFFQISKTNCSNNFVSANVCMHSL